MIVGKTKYVAKVWRNGEAEFFHVRSTLPRKSAFSQNWIACEKEVDVLEAMRKLGYAVEPVVPDVTIQ